MSYPNKACEQKRLILYCSQKKAKSKLSRVVIFFLILFLPFTSVLSQSQRLDSLWNVWDSNSKADSSRIKALNEIASSYLESNPDSSNYYGQIALDLAREKELNKQIAMSLRVLGRSNSKLRNFPESLENFKEALTIHEYISSDNEIARSLGNIGIVYQMTQLADSAQIYLEKALQTYDEHGSKEEIYLFMRRLAMVYGQRGQNEKSMELFTKLLDRSIELGDSVQAAGDLVNIGQGYSAMGDFQTALEYYRRALPIFEKFKHERYLANTLASIGRIYSFTQEFEKALDYHLQAYEIFIKIDEKPSLIGSCSNLAIIYFNLGEFELSLEYSEKGFQLSKEYHNGYIDPQFLASIGIAYNGLGKYELAINYIEQALSIIKGSSNKVVEANYLQYLGLAHHNSNNYTKAISAYAESYAIAKAMGHIILESWTVEYLYKVYKEVYKMDSALKYHEQWWALSDSLKKTETNNELLQIEFERQRLVDSLAVVEDKLRTELAFQETLSTEKQTRNTFMYTGIGILLIAGGLFGRMRYIRGTNKKLEEKNKIIASEKVKVEESEKAKAEFFNNVSHEFRTPLTLIVGPLVEVLEKPIDETCRPNLQIMQRSALRLQGMIDELLDLSKLEFKKVGLMSKEENIVTTTREYLQSFESFADQRNIKLSFKSDAKDYKVWLDLEKYRKILANLLSNAFKFTDEGGTVSVSVGSPGSSDTNKPSQEGVEIRITDSGIGIPPDKIQHVFERFFQVGDNSFTQQAGTGIGLALTKELVELHHGTIRVESEQGKGTTFIIFIPFGKEHLSDLETHIVEEITSETPGTKSDWIVEEDISGFVLEEEMRKKNDKPIILITEDNPDMLTYIKSHLEHKYTILKARDGEEGLSVALEKVPDLIISDVMMPRMDGNEMTEKLKTDQRTSHIPVILLTARASVDSKIEGLETGADAYLTKPFNARELKVRVKNLIEQRQKLRELFSGELNTGNSIDSSSNLSSMDQKFIQKMIDVVNEHLSDPEFKPTEFASEMALSRSQLHRKIKGVTNKTTGEFVRTIRLNKAAEMLKAKADTVTQIAYSTGFNNLSWFAKAFKEQYGVSPSEFMRESGTS